MKGPVQTTKLYIHTAHDKYATSFAKINVTFTASWNLFPPQPMQWDNLQLGVAILNTTWTCALSILQSEINWHVYSCRIGSFTLNSSYLLRNPFPVT